MRNNKARSREGLIDKVREAAEIGEWPTPQTDGLESPLEEDIAVAVELEPGDDDDNPDNLTPETLIGERGADHWTSREDEDELGLEDPEQLARKEAALTPAQARRHGPRPKAVVGVKK